VELAHRLLVDKAKPMRTAHAFVHHLSDHAPVLALGLRDRRTPPSTRRAPTRTVCR
jgi:hypothetical protein